MENFIRKRLLVYLLLFTALKIFFFLNVSIKQQKWPGTIAHWQNSCDQLNTKEILNSRSYSKTKLYGKVCGNTM